MLKEIRLLRGYTQQKLADSIGKDRSLIAKIENGSAKPSVDTAKALAGKLGVEWMIFFAHQGEENPHNQQKSSKNSQKT